jgi:hypothetical protein
MVEPMEKRLVDPRDVEWEQDETCYRVYFWDKVNMTSHEYELTESTIEKALAWARSHAKEEGWEYTFYVKVTAQAQCGLVRIEGKLGDPFADD